MLTRVHIRNFKRFGDIEIALAPVAVFIGPNNSGKTTAMQALTLWQYALSAWLERRKENNAARTRVGVTVNRKDIVTVPVGSALQLWRNLSTQTSSPGGGRKHTDRIPIEIVVSGEAEDGSTWALGMRLNYASPETLRCEPFLQGEADTDLHEVASRVASQSNIQLLPPMSGLASTEFHLQEGAINQLLGQGKSADVLRNLCYIVSEADSGGWDRLTQTMRELFGIQLHRPEHVVHRGEITLSYTHNGARSLDISAAGRGLQQTLLLLAWLYKAQPGSVLLLDEPDAHLEFLRQQQIYGVLKDLAKRRRCQIVAASHSEVLLNEAASRQDQVVVFVGRPHVMDNSAQTRKALTSIGFDSYIKAEQTGWVFYLEGSTDLEILRRFASRLQHTEAVAALTRPFVHYVQHASKAYNHFFGLCEAKQDLVGLIVMDRQERDSPIPNERLPLYTWTRREIENYFAFPEVLYAFARSLAAQEAPGSLFEKDLAAQYLEHMEACVANHVTPAALANRSAPWWKTVKATDDLLDNVFADFAQRLRRPLALNKGGYYELIGFMPPEQIDMEVREMLDRIVGVARTARPVT